MSLLRTVLPSAYLPGGAIRDFDNGRTVKDLDVFYTEGHANIVTVECALMGLYAYKNGCPGEYMDAAREVMGTQTYRSLTGLPELNLILLEKEFNPPAIIERVDFGLCQIGADPLGVEYTPAYEFDRANECFTLMRAESVEGVIRSLKRYDRLKQKYPGWDLWWRAEHDDIVMAAMRLSAADRIKETF